MRGKGRAGGEGRVLEVRGGSRDTGWGEIDRGKGHRPEYVSTVGTANILKTHILLYQEVNIWMKYKIV